MQISFRGVVEVVAPRDNELTIDVSVGDILAQKCVFPFAYKNQNYVSCTNIDFGYNWCSPTAQYSGQDLKCSAISKFSFSLLKILILLQIYVTMLYNN